MKGDRFQLAYFFLNSSALFASVLLVAFFVFYLHGLFLRVAGEYDSRSRLLARDLLLRILAEQLYIGSSAQMAGLAGDGIEPNKQPFPRLLDWIASSAAPSFKKVAPVAGFDQGIVFLGGSVSRGDAAEFLRQIAAFSSIGGTGWLKKYPDRRRYLVSADSKLVYVYPTPDLAGLDGDQGRFDKAPDLIAEFARPLPNAFSASAAPAGAKLATRYSRAFDPTSVVIFYAPVFSKAGLLKGYVGSDVSVPALIDRQQLQQLNGKFAVFDPAGAQIYADSEFGAIGKLHPATETRSRFSEPDYRIDGSRLLIVVDAPQLRWRLVYGYPARQLVIEKNTEIAIACTLLIAGLSVIVLITRAMKRNIFIPAEHNEKLARENQKLYRMIGQLTPVGLCLLNRADAAVLVKNEIAETLLQFEVPLDGRRVGIADYFVALPVNEGSGTYKVEFTAFAPSSDMPCSMLVLVVAMQYSEQAVLLCSFADTSERKRHERQLAAAKEAADSANQAKSAFLATMSHEIRTPLYGVLGTLELLEQTALQPRQRGYLETMRSSSDVLLQLINDVLDFSKIEAGQLALEIAPFNAIELIENGAKSFASLACKKGVMLYCCLQPDCPILAGDRNRLLQVLNNLLSNAVKFTDSGQIVVRLTGAEIEPGYFDLRLQVADSGIGMREDDQHRLFEPFTQVDSSTARRYGGTGLGLSICRRLVALMDGEIELVSEVGLGSSFSVLLRLPIVDRPAAVDASVLPMVHISAQVGEMRDSLLGLIRYAGGQAQALAQPPSTRKADLLLLAWPWPEPLPDVAAFVGVVWLERDGSQSPERQPDGWHVSLLGQRGILDALRLAAGVQALEAAPAAAQPRQVGTGRTILVVEDHPINQLVLTGQLKQLGYTVKMAGDGEQALRYWHDGEAFDAVLTDVNMPIMDGYELTRRLRAEGIVVPIVGVTANAHADERARCLEAGMNGYLAKPVSLDALGQALQATGLSAESPSTGATSAAIPGAFDRLKPEMRTLFVTTTKADLAEIERGVIEAEPAIIQQHTHRMKSALAFVGADEALQWCDRIEARAAANELDQIGDDLEQLARLLAPLLGEEKWH